MVFCNKTLNITNESGRKVTILILIDGFLQSNANFIEFEGKLCHNPYFNRWFSAINLSNGIPFIEILSQSLF